MTKGEFNLAKRIGAAEERIKQQMKTVKHRDSCPVENDPEGYAPCNCGASAQRQGLQTALDALKLDDDV